MSTRSACRYARNERHTCRTRRPMNSVCTRVQMNCSSNRYSHWPAGAAAGGRVEIGFTLKLLRNVRHETQDTTYQQPLNASITVAAIPILSRVRFGPLENWDSVFESRSSRGCLSVLIVLCRANPPDQEVGFIPSELIPNRNRPEGQEQKTKK